MRKYKIMIDIDEARSWGEKYYSSWLPEYQVGGSLRSIDLDNEFYKDNNQVDKKNRQDMLENKWFSYYCGGNWGLAINEKLRFGNTSYTFPEEQLEEMKMVLDMRLKQSYIPEDIMGFRYLDYNDLCFALRKRIILPGMVIEDKGYLGVGLVKTSLEEEYGRCNTLLKIMIPQGAQGLYLDLISNRRREQEVLFARGSRMRVLFCYKKKGKRVFVCKML